MDRTVADDFLPNDGAREEQMWDMLRSVRCPSLVVRGVGSAILKPQVALRMAHHALPKGQLATISRAGHAVMTDNPGGIQPDDPDLPCFAVACRKRRSVMFA